MVVDVLLWVLLGVGLLGLVGLVLRKLPVVRVIDTSKLDDLNQRLVKFKLVEQRLRRKLQSMFSSVGNKLTPTRVVLKEGVERVRGVLQHATARVERRLDEHTSPVRTADDFLQQAEAELKAGHYEAAEAQYLRALRQDTHSLAAYEGLGLLYLASREYEQAREVFEYLVGRGQASAHLGLARAAAGQGQLEQARQEYQVVLAGAKAAQPQLELARVLLELGDPAEAFLHLREARRIEPRNPKLLDFYIELSIVNGQPIEAQSALDALREVNPENQKIPELAQAIRVLADKLKLKVKRPQRGGHTTTFGVPTKRKS